MVGIGGQDIRPFQEAMQEHDTIVKASKNGSLLSVSGDAARPHFKEVGFFGKAFRLIKSKVFNNKDAFKDCESTMVAEKIRGFFHANLGSIFVHRGEGREIRSILEMRERPKPVETKVGSIQSAVNAIKQFLK